jgi:CBS-domain-containing membrane protein
MTASLSESQAPRGDAMKAADVMVTDVITVGPTAGVERVAEILMKNRIERVPIVKNGTMVGIVSRGNLLQALRPMMGQGPRPHWRMARNRVCTDCGVLYKKQVRQREDCICAGFPPRASR